MTVNSQYEIQQQFKFVTKLSEYISISDRFARSINLDRDRDRVEPLEAYIVTGRALSVVERFATVAAKGEAGGAWSVTGPYGSGKSSLALLIDAAFGPSSKIRDTSWKLIDDISPDIAELIRQSHRRADTTTEGFFRGVITASREPIGHTILRALHSAVIRRFGRIPPSRSFRAAKTLKDAYKSACSDEYIQNFPPTAALEIAGCLAQDFPLMLVIDEFGKNLEAIGDDRATDPYLLQQLAESGQGLGLPIFILTLQHQSFDDYFAGANKSKRLEWSKVQGRFEEIPYIESNKQSRNLISSVFRVNGKHLKERIADWANCHFFKLSKLGISDFKLPSDIASCYPLHPLTTLLVPELCNRFGQHERTLFSFLTDSDIGSVNEFVSACRLTSETDLPSVGLDSMFDYFVGRGTIVNVVAGQQNRWIELATRIRDVQGLTQRQLKLAKSIAILNLISTAGSLRASRQLLEYTAVNYRDSLEELESIGLVIYREHSDEYRIWQGSNIRLNELIEDAIQEVKKEPIGELLQQIDSPSPIVAARHSAETETLRVFHSRYSDGNEVIEPIAVDSPYDGELILVIGDKIPKLINSKKTTKPTVCAIPESFEDLTCSFRKVAAFNKVLNNSNVQRDLVACSELRERIAIIQTELQKSIREAFYSKSCRWIHLDGENETVLKPGKGSAPLSEVADRIYGSPPGIQNEMINRAELSTQGAKARRLVIEAMVTNGDFENLKLEGYGPEVAVYKAVIKQSGIHGFDSRNGVWVFRKPTENSLKPIWNAIVEEFNHAKHRRMNLWEIYVKLMAPPFGVKAGVLPILFSAALLAYRNEIAIYEHGTFQPMLSSALAERMVRNPQHFDVKHFANTTGARRQVVEALAQYFGLTPSFRKHRVANVLTVVSHLVVKIGKLNQFALGTQSISSETIKVRSALLSAVEPDELIFSALPKAIGTASISTNDSAYTEVTKYAESLKCAMDELIHCYGSMLDEIKHDLLDSFSAKKRVAVSGQAASLDGVVLNPDVRAFVFALANDTYDDQNWIKAIATVVSNKAPELWTDENYVHFQYELKRRVEAFHRLLALNIERRAIGDEGFIATRVTFTKPDGREKIDLVGSDEALQDASKEVLDSALEKLKKIVGTEHHAQKTLLALISERYFENSEENKDTKRISLDIRRVRND